MYQSIFDIINDYDRKIPIHLYLYKLLGPDSGIPEDDMDFKICCPLHDEVTPSFSYSASRNCWSCFGVCNVTGKVFEFHKRYTQKYKNIQKPVYMTLLRELYNMFPQYVNEPVIQSNITGSLSKSEVFNDLNKIVTQDKIFTFSGKKEITLKENIEDINGFILNEFIGDSKLARRCIGGNI